MIGKSANNLYTYWFINVPLMVCMAYRLNRDLEDIIEMNDH